MWQVVHMALPVFETRRKPPFEPFLLLSCASWQLAHSTVLLPPYSGSVPTVTAPDAAVVTAV
jgi:hypothetical protein